MAYGVNLENSQGQIMFSTDYVAFHFVGKYTAVALAGGRLSASFSCNGTPIIFVDGASGVNAAGLLQLTNTSGTNWTAIVAGRTTANAALTSLDIYVFAAPNAPTTSGYGMWAKNGDGVTTLNFSQRVLKIAGAYQTTLSSSSSSTTIPDQAITFGSIPSDYIVCAPALGEILGPAGPNTLLLGVFPHRVSATTVGLRAGYLYATFGGTVAGYRVYEQQYVMFADKSLYQ